LSLDLVDVRDVAVAHVEAMERPGAKGRYLMVARNVTILEVQCRTVLYCTVLYFSTLIEFQPPVSGHCSTPAVEYFAVNYTVQVLQSLYRF